MYCKFAFALAMPKNLAVKRAGEGPTRSKKSNDLVVPLPNLYDVRDLLTLITITS